MQNQDALNPDNRPPIAMTKLELRVWASTYSTMLAHYQLVTPKPTEGTDAITEAYKAMRTRQSKWAATCADEAVELLRALDKEE